MLAFETATATALLLPPKQQCDYMFSGTMTTFLEADESPLNGKTLQTPPVTAEKIVAVPKKQPPPESKEGIRVRQLVILSFWAIAVFLGAPIWLWTTSIHRARLPLQEMMDWAEGRVILTDL